MKILITAPSLSTQYNVSGISSAIIQILEHGNEEFYHFVAGRRDGERIGVIWFFRQISGFRLFRREIRDKQIDIVHINTALAPLSIVRHAVLAKFANRPVLLHIHGGRFFTQKFDNLLLKWLTGTMLRRAKVVLVLSEIEKRFIEKRWQNIDVRVLENSIALEEAETRKVETGEKMIIFLGRLHEDKGLREIVKACRILKNANFQFRFRCFGTGDAREKFVSEMTGILGEKFFFGGIASGKEKWKELAQGDIFLLPSHYEGLPMSLLEAMAAGCVPVASEIGSIGSVVREGFNGFLIEPRNVPQIVEKLKNLLSDKADWENLRRNARKTVEENFNLKDYIKKLEYIYAEIDEKS